MNMIYIFFKWIRINKNIIEINNIKIRNSSYINNIRLVASSESIEKNNLLLENTTEKLLQLQNQNNI